MVSQPLSVSAPANIESLYKFTDDVSDPQLFESWKPKIAAYRQALADSLQAEYKLPETEIPGDLDETSFSTVQFLKETKHLTPQERQITESSATELLRKMETRELSAVAVLKAFAHRAVIAHQLTNFACEFFVHEALQRAKQLDEYLAVHGKLAGPLHGIPISLKEQIGYAGKITHGGWVAWLDNVPKEDAVTVQVLRNLGAVFYVRTNEPQTLMHLDSNNNIVGRTRNPHNSLLTAGGSSGGEGASVGSRASPLGVGTDIGGSIRGPAAFSGVYGLRPTSRRISTFGGVSSGKGQESIVAVAGPLANSVDDIELFMRAYINAGKPWDLDPWSLPMPWRQVAVPEPQTLTVAVMYDDGIVKPLPPIIRGLKHTADKLQQAGVNVVEFQPLETDKLYEVAKLLYNCDGNHAQKEMLRPSGEPLLPLTKWALSFGQGDRALSITENRELNYQRDRLRKLYNDYFVQNKVDFILCPNYCGPAPVCVQNGVEGPYYWGYTSHFNLLDLPSLTGPTGLYADQKVDTKPEYTPRSTIEAIEHAKYKPELVHGAPICYQLVGRRYSDEEVVAAGKLLGQILELD
ncbi:hypothetical protein KL937_001293 [Ogataea polymorpha]|nr:hypothetical protein KL937_001293 [Ogataea polymorpha]KAG7938760.1 hypothetical protein KL904_001289 [Ogataea polymorpha]